MPESVYSFPYKQYPLYLSAVSAGFPSPAEDYIAAKLDLNELLVSRPTATFFMRISGNGMAQAGIHHNDILVIDRSINPSNGKLIVADIAGKFTIRRCKKIKNGIKLLEEKEGEEIETVNNDDVTCWGVVTHIIHSV